VSDATREHRLLLAETIRRVSRWRLSVSDEYSEEGNKDAQRQNYRAALALRRLANFVEALPEDDRDLNNLRSCPLTRDGRAYHLTEKGSRILSRFWINIGAATGVPAPSEAQMRNVLRRVDGAERSGSTS